MKILAKVLNFILSAIIIVFAFAFIFNTASALHESGVDLNVIGYIVLILPIFALAFALIQRKKALLLSLVIYFVALVLGFASGMFEELEAYEISSSYLTIPFVLVIIKSILLKVGLVKEGKNTGLDNNPVVTVRGNETYDLSKIQPSFSVWGGRVANFYDNIEVLTVRLMFGKGPFKKYKMEPFSYDQIAGCKLHKTRRRGIAIDAYEDIYVQLIVRDYQVPAVNVSFLEGSFSELNPLTSKALNEADQFAGKIQLIMNSRGRYHR